MKYERNVTIFTSFSLSDTLDDCNTMTNLIFVLVAYPYLKEIPEYIESKTYISSILLSLSLYYILFIYVHFILFSCKQQT